MEIADAGGLPMNWQWVQDNFGDIRVAQRPRPDEPGFVVSHIWESIQDVSIVVCAPLCTRIARWWPDPDLPSLPEGFEHTDKGIWGTAYGAAVGTVNFAMGRGDAYDPSHQVGASSVWCEGNSELVSGLGWIAGTHYRHLNVEFEWVEPASELELEMLAFRAGLEGVKTKTALLELALERIERLARGKS